MMVRDWLEARNIGFRLCISICTTGLRGRWSDGQLAHLFSIAFLFTARGQRDVGIVDASNVSPMRVGVLMADALVKPAAHVSHAILPVHTICHGVDRLQGIGVCRSAHASSLHHCISW